MKALCTFMGLLLIGAAVAGVYVGGSELLSPSVHAAKADKLEAEASALLAQTAYEARQHEIELTLAEQKAAAELQALQARRARQLELVEPIAIVGMVVGSVAALTLTATVSYYLIAKARATTGKQVSEGEQLVQYRAVPSPSKQEQGRAPEGGRTPSSIEESKVCSDQVTYDGFLAYFDEYILHPNRVRVFYRKGIAPEVEDIYLTILTEMEIITWKTNGHSGWILPGEIRSVEDVRLRISRCAFYNLVSTCRTLSTTESLLFRGVKLQQEASRAFSSS